MEVEAVTQILTKSLTKQDITLSDATKTVRVVLWNDDVGKLVEDQSYQLKDVKLYGGIKYLSITTASVIKEITEIGEVSIATKKTYLPQAMN